MKMSSSYNFEIQSFGSQGTRVTLRKRQSFLTVASCLLLCVFNMFTFLHNQGRPPEQKYFFMVSVLLTVSFIIYSLTKVHTESLLILSSIGVTIKQTSVLSSTSKYFDVQHIQDIVIVEAISMHRVICEIVLLPRNKSSIDKRKMYPLFTSFRPKLQDLKTIYRHVQEKLMIPGVKLDR